MVQQLQSIQQALPEYDIRGRRDFVAAAGDERDFYVATEVLQRARIIYYCDPISAAFLALEGALTRSTHRCQCVAEPMEGTLCPTSTGVPG